MWKAFLIFFDLIENKFFHAVFFGLEKLDGLGSVTRNQYLLRAEIEQYRITVFPDGRAIIGGTDDITEARTAYARYIGN